LTEIVLPAGTMSVTVREIPGLLARAIHPTSDDRAWELTIGKVTLSKDDAERLRGIHTSKMFQVIAEENHRANIQTAISRGELVALNLSRLPIPASATGAQVDNAMVMIDALKAYALPMGVTVRADTPQAAPVVAVGDGPAPLSRTEIAECFAGLRDWDVTRWKKELSSPNAWLKVCRHGKGERGRGSVESTWWPVDIAAAMLERGDTSAKLLSNKFKAMGPLKPWRDAWENNNPEAI
jgi:hypothetical protein